MRIAEPGLDFWLTYLETKGGVWEAESEASALALLPQALQEIFELSEEVLLSTDPEVAREEGGLLLIPGHPALDQAASEVLDRGDVGTCFVPWPDRPAPALVSLVQSAREQMDIEHGRIDPGAVQPAPVHCPVLRVAAMVSYTLSLEDSFQEREEVWVDARTGLILDDPVVRNLREASPASWPQPSGRVLGARLPEAVAYGHAALRQRATDRSKQLARYAERGRAGQLARVSAYYQGVLESISHRRKSATAERAQLLDAQAEATRVERGRRMAEVEESHRPSFQIRPFRLHLVGVPALEVAVDVRRGDRRYPMQLVWLLAAGRFAIPTCPKCGGSDPLVAGRQRLGCRACLPRAKPSVVSPIRSYGAPAGPGRMDGPSVADAVQASDAGKGREPDQTKRPSIPRATGPERPRDASRRRPVPSPVRTQPRGDRIAKLSKKLAANFWMAASGDQRWRSKQTVPRSPLAILHRLYGTGGAVCAIGMAPGELPDVVTSATLKPVPGEPEFTGGWVRTSTNSYSFSLRWRSIQGVAVVAEVMPFPPTGDLSLPTFNHLPAAVTERLLYPPEPRVELGPVELSLWQVGLPVYGLPGILRAMALGDSEDIHELDVSPECLAAGLLREALRRSGKRETLAEVGAEFGVDVDPLRELTRALQQLIRRHGITF